MTGQVLGRGLASIIFHEWTYTKEGGVSIISMNGQILGRGLVSIIFMIGQILGRSLVSIFFMIRQILGRGLVSIIFPEWTDTREGRRLHYFS